MAKRIIAEIRLQLPAGAANPAPPVGPALGPHGVNIMEFCKAYNAKTKDMIGMIIPVVISLYTDRTFTFILKSPPASILLKRAAGISKGSEKPNMKKIGYVTKEQVMEIAKVKMKDLNTLDEIAAYRMIEGTAKNMGIEIKINNK